MAADSTRALLDEFNTNVLEAIGEVKSIEALKELMKNDHILEGYRIQCEEDKIWNQREKDFASLEQEKELKEKELEVRKLEIEQRREAVILESKYRDEELSLKREIHMDEDYIRQKEMKKELELIEVKREENRLKAEENSINKRKMILECVIKGGTVVAGIALTGLAIYVGNEGILNKTVIEIAQSLVLRKA